jgi:hypothetical protein
VSLPIFKLAIVSSYAALDPVVLKKARFFPQDAVIKEREEARWAGRSIAPGLRCVHHQAVERCDKGRAASERVRGTRECVRKRSKISKYTGIRLGGLCLFMTISEREEVGKCKEILEVVWFGRAGSDRE